MPESRLEIARRRDDLTAASEQRLEDEAGHRRSGRRQYLAHRVAVGDSHFSAMSAMRSAIAIGHRHHVHPRFGRAAAAVAQELVRTDVNQGAGVAVVGALDHEKVPPAGVGSGEPQRQLVGFAARVDHEADGEWLRQGRGQAGRVVGQLRVEVAGVGVEQRHLTLPGRHHVWMAVADVADVVDEVEIRPAAVVVEVLPGAADDLERLVVGEAERRADAVATLPQQLIRTLIEKRLFGEERTARRQRVDRHQSRQQLPGRLFGGEVVGVVDAPRAAPRSAGETSDEPPADEREEDLALRFPQRSPRLVAGDDLGADGERVAAAHHGVGDRYGELTDGGVYQGVTEIDDADHTIAGDKDVLVVEVAMDPRSRKLGEQRNGPGEIEMKGVLQQPTTCWITNHGDAVLMLGDPCQ